MRCVFAALLLVVHFFTWSQYQLQEFYVDNRTADTVYVVVDGKPLVEINPFDYAVTEIRPGEHQFETYRLTGDSLLESFTETIVRMDRKMYNVLNRGVYVQGEQGYSSNPWAGDNDGSLETVVTGRWIDLHQHYVFEDPPQEISVEWRLGDDNKTTRTYLRHRN